MVSESIREQSVRLEHQIDKLINLGNLESADYGRDREVITVDEFTNGLLAPFEQPARDRRIDLTLQIDPTEEKLFADRADLRRACQALVENAVKFTRDGGQVRVRIEAMPDGGLRFGVSDVNTHPDAGICKTCWNHFRKDITLTTEWKEYQVLFSEMKQRDGWGDPRPANITPDQLMAFNFDFEGGQKFEVWLDDMQFLACR